MKTILHSVDVHAPPSTVWRALTTREGLAGWWSNRVEADVRVGGLVRFTFLPIFNPIMEVSVLEQARLVAWRCVGGHEAWA